MIVLFSNLKMYSFVNLRKVISKLKTKHIMHHRERERERERSANYLKFDIPLPEHFFDNTGFMQFYETGLPNSGNYVPPKNFLQHY